MSKMVTLFFKRWRREKSDMKNKQTEIMSFFIDLAGSSEMRAVLALSFQQGSTKFIERMRNKSLDIT